MSDSSWTLLDTSQPRKASEVPVVFLDRTFSSAKIAAHLSVFSEWRIELHGSHFKGDCPDPLWIKECAKRGWILLSCDKEIRRSPENRDAVEKSGAKLFFVNAKNKRAEDYMDILGLARHRILRLAKKHKGPFFASITGASAEVKLLGSTGDDSPRDKTLKKYRSGRSYYTTSRTKKP